MSKYVDENGEFIPPEPGLLVMLKSMKVANADRIFYELRKEIMKECKLWEGPYGDYYMMLPDFIGADK